MPTTSFPAVISFGDQQLGRVTLDENNQDSYSKKLSNAVDVQEIDTNLFMSKQLWIPLGSRGVFGGEIVSQSLRAAWNTVDDKFYVHSIHCNFLMAGDFEIPVLYQVQRLRDGRSFATRFVTATQKGKPIFVCSCSFTTASDAVHLEHMASMPTVPDPEDVPNNEQRIQASLDLHPDAHPLLKMYLEERLKEAVPMEYRDIRLNDPSVEFMRDAVDPDPRQYQWFRAKERVETDDRKVHACILAYASDSNLLATANQANGLSFPSKRVGMMASLDHSIWFHHPCRADEWLLYDMHSPRSTGARGTAFGRIFTRDGILVATTSQEGLIRLRPSEQKRLMEERAALDAKTNLRRASQL
ncbi:Thioesterase/thiol ester dehydrase-isomerase [Hesseltinella vesiculosa]|uniref:Thioesterase/thiol ester dehydrase-isomerase n=1 Tax=Hesseltinella vesiculosa TaxID=101127 RepID=A0A1X2GQF1_9FUNG|nr:Thioesterase/thiol ester dehydrase-isomerase [Hesseltinella vesiculosa]